MIGIVAIFGANTTIKSWFLYTRTKYISVLEGLDGNIMSRVNPLESVFMGSCTSPHLSLWLQIQPSQ